MTTKLVADQNEESSYYGELSLAMRAETKQKLHEIKSKFNEDGLRVKVVLESGNGEEITPEVLEVWSVDWEEWDKL